MFQIITRDVWAARKPTSVKHVPVPVRETWLHHSASGQHGAQGVRDIQAYHMDRRGWSDIAYSFVVDDHPDGPVRIFEGRGWGVAGAHTAGHNTVSHGFCVAGNFEVRRPSTAALEAVAWLLRRQHRLGFGPQALSGGHRDVAATACPGRFLYEQIPLTNRLAATMDSDVDAAEGDDMPRPIMRDEESPRVLAWLHRLRIACDIRGVDLHPNFTVGAEFDGPAQAQVNRFKKSHGLPEDGVLDYDITTALIAEDAHRADHAIQLDHS